MRALRAIGRFIWRFMVIFSFIVNVILVIVLLVLGLLIFEIKNEVAQPLVNGLHSSFVGLDQATIDWTIPVRDEIPVVMNIPLDTDTVVTLTQPVPLQVNALIDLPGINAYNVNAAVNLTLPAGLELPVALDLDVPVDETLDVALDVRAVIPLEDTQLHDVAENLRLLFEPLARGLTNLPNDFGEAGDLVGDVLRGSPPDLLAENDYSRNPWPGYSLTAGAGYELFGEPVPGENRPIETGIVPVGGIPALDEELRPDIYAAGGPEAINERARAELNARNVPAYFFNGQIGEVARSIQPGESTDTVSPENGEGDEGIIQQTDGATGGPEITPTPESTDLGIISTPQGE